MHLKLCTELNCSIADTEPPGEEGQNVQQPQWMTQEQFDSQAEGNYETASAGQSDNGEIFDDDGDYDAEPSTLEQEALVPQAQV